MLFRSLNPTTGAQIWKYTPTDMPALSTLAVAQNNRGVAYGQGLIFDARTDAKLVALNAKTGAVAWEATVDLPSNEASMSLAPQYIVANGGKQPEVLVGVTVSEAGVRGHLDAYDSATGQVVLIWVALIFAAAFRWLRALAHTPEPARLWTRTGDGGAS